MRELFDRRLFASGGLLVLALAALAASTRQASAQGPWICGGGTGNLCEKVTNCLDVKVASSCTSDYKYYHTSQE